MGRGFSLHLRSKQCNETGHRALLRVHCASMLCVISWTEGGGRELQPLPPGRVLRSRRGRNHYTTDKLGNFENLVDILYRKVTFPRIRRLPLTQADVISCECLLTCGSVCLDKKDI